MDKKIVILVIGILIILAGIALIAVTEPSGGAGSVPSFGIADVSEDTRPYLWHGVIVIMAGIAAVILAFVKI